MSLYFYILYILCIILCFIYYIIDYVFHFLFLSLLVEINIAHIYTPTLSSKEQKITPKVPALQKMFRDYIFHKKYILWTLHMFSNNCVRNNCQT